MRTSARRGRRPLTLELTPEEATELAVRVRAPTSTQRDAARARIILACAEGGSAREIAARLDVPVRRVERAIEYLLFHTNSEEKRRLSGVGC